MELPIKVEGIIFRKNNEKIEYLLLKRTPSDGGFWQPMTGTPYFDESLKDCLLRELQEETGIREVNKITDEIYRFSWLKKDYVVVELVYGVEVKNDVKIIVSHEHTDYKWCQYDDAIAMFEKENNVIALKLLNKHLKNN